MHAKLALLLAAVLWACGPSTVDVSGGCIAAVNVDGVLFTGGESLRVAPADVGSLYVVVTRHTGCLDQGEPADPLGHGESNFLDVGTAIHRVVGFEADARLTYWSDVVDEWLPLTPAGFY